MRVGGLVVPCGNRLPALGVGRSCSDLFGSMVLRAHLHHAGAPLLGYTLSHFFFFLNLRRGLAELPMPASNSLSSSFSLLNCWDYSHVPHAWLEFLDLIEFDFQSFLVN